MHCGIKNIFSSCRWEYCGPSGLCSASEMETSKGGSIRIQLMANSPSLGEGRSRFPKLDECAHFHYEHVELGPLQVSLCEEEDLKPLSTDQDDGKWWSVSVLSHGKTWHIRRSYENFRMLDHQLHRCIYDRKFSGLKELPSEIIEEQENIHELLSEYLAKFSVMAGSLINCGPVLNWLEMDNRGYRLLVPDTDNCPINTPAVAAAYAVKRYAAQAADEISFEVGDMISVIDMPPPEESIWWRGKRGFQVGFFPCECVAVIGDKVPRYLHFSAKHNQPMKPVLRKHGKLIAFFRSFILSRPSRRRLKQSGILKERVFGCDLGEHLLNSGHEIPMVLKCCAEFIESHGIVDGIYRLSGVTSNIQRLRNAFDEDRVPLLYDDDAIVQDIHSVASLLKMYFRELPNPLCTYQLYQQFVNAVQATEGDDNRLSKMRDTVQKLPPPHYRTLEYVMRHLARVAEKGHETGMTPRNVAIVWAPNLLRCKELEVGGVAALQGVGVQAVVTEFLICYSDMIFSDRLPNVNIPPQQVTPKRSRPKSLAISTPTKLLSLEEARTRALLQAAGKPEQDYIEVGGGPSSLPAKYHTIIELPSGSRKRFGSKRSPLGWKSIFGKSARSSHSRKENQRKVSTPTELALLKIEKAVTESDLAQSKRRLRPAKSVESLNSGGTSRNSAALDVSEAAGGMSSPDDTLSPMPLRTVELKGNGHNRSVSHDSYFDQLTENQDDERFNSNLDISEIQLNFDLEESEMRIFSEDETLMSVGSGSMVSQNSPRIQMGQKLQKSQGLHLKLSHAKLARGEESISSSQSNDPSPKKLKITDDEAPGKRSRLEEQLTSSSGGDLQFIDYVSPEQVVVMAEVHLMQSPSPISSLSQISNTSPILPHIPHLQRPLSQQITSDLATTSSDGRPKSQQFNLTKNSYFNNNTKLTNSTSNKIKELSSEQSTSVGDDNESLHSSGLTTPDTPLQQIYSPLLETEESSFSNTTTPDKDNLDKIKKNNSENENLDKKMSRVNIEFNNEKNIGEEYENFENMIDMIVDNKMSNNTRYENVTNEMLKILQETNKTTGVSVKSDSVCLPVPEERKNKPKHLYENVPLTKKNTDSENMKKNIDNNNHMNLLLETSFDSVVAEKKYSPDKRDSQISIKYVNISTESSCDSLINFNRSDECHKSLLTNKSESNNASPIIEDNCLIENVCCPVSELISFDESPLDVDVLIEEKKKSFINLFDDIMKEDLKEEERVDVKEEAGVDVMEARVDVMEAGVDVIEARVDVMEARVEGIEARVGVIEERVNVIEEKENISNIEDEMILVKENDKTRVLETCFEFDKKDESCLSIENALFNLATSPKRTSPSYHKTRSKVDDDRERKLPLDKNEIIEDLQNIVEKVNENKETQFNTSGTGNVKNLLCKFENDKIVDVSVDYDKIKFRKQIKNVAPCEKVENDEVKPKESVLLGSELGNNGKKQNDIIERPKTIERIPSRRKNEDRDNQNLEKSKSGSQIDNMNTSSIPRFDFSDDINLDLSDPQRRERIEKYKEKRRNYLREKYRTDSFKNENEEFVLRLKQRTSDEKIDDSDSSRKAPFDKPARKILSQKDPIPQCSLLPPIKPDRKTAGDKKQSEKKIVIEKPVRRMSGGKIVERIKSPEKTVPNSPFRKDLYKKSVSVDNKSKQNNEPVTSRYNRSLSKDSHESRSSSNFKSPASSPVKKTSGSSSLSSLSPEKQLPGVKKQDGKFDKTFSSSESGIESSRSSFDSRSSLEQAKSIAEPKLTVTDEDVQQSPTYCIKEITGLFERKDSSSSSTSPEPHKQYLSSV